MKVLGISFEEEQIAFIERQDDTKSGYVRGLVERAMKRERAKKGKKKKAVAKKVVKRVKRRPQPTVNGERSQQSTSE